MTPNGTEQIVALLRSSAAHGAPLTFRSGGTSLSGQASSAGVLDDGLRVRVQPGTTVRAVNARLSPFKRKLGPDPASEGACTIGGVVANNSSGMACGTGFNNYRPLESAVLVLPSGTVIDTRNADADRQLRALESVLHEGLLRLRDRIRANPGSLATIEKLYSITNTMGYGLNSFVDHDTALQMLLHLVIGSEGALAFVAAATFRTLPAPSHLAPGFLIFGGLGQATAALPELVAAGFSTIELLDTCSQLVELFTKHDYADGVIFGHAKNGNTHFMLNERFCDGSSLDRYAAFSDDMVDLVLAHDGTLTAEHGTGRVTAPFVCPSKDLTLTPRLRIVLRRGMAEAQAAGDTDLLASLHKDYQYDGVDTRAVKKLPAPLVTGAAALTRKLPGADAVPLWQEDLPGGGCPRLPRRDATPAVVYFAAHIGTLFRPAAGAPGVTRASLDLCERAKVQLAIPDGIASMCCGTPWKSKGLTDGYEEMRERVLPALWEASDHGRIPVVCDAASCTEGFGRPRGYGDERFPGLRIIDAVEFIDERVLGSLSIAAPVGSLALHPTCSSTQLGSNAALSRIAEAIAAEGVIPDGWGCCAFAGDRGMLHPELTASATLREAAAVSARRFNAYASTNRTCELGPARATGHQHEHLLETLERASRPTEWKKTTS